MRISMKGASIIFLAMLFLPIASASIGVSQLNGVYNRGDDFNITITVSPPKDTSNFLTAKLVCGSEGTDLYKSPLHIEGDTKKVISIATNLDSFLISGMQGECLIKAEYGDEQAVSRTFNIESAIDVTFNLEGISFDPGETLNVNGRAVKKTGEPLNGFAEITVPDLAFNFFTDVVEGQFSTNITIPANSFSGTYEVQVRAYEKDSSGIAINDGTTTNSIKINQLIKELNVALGSQEVAPGNEFTYRVVVYDQAGEEVETDVPVVIYKPDEEIFEKNLVSTSPNETNSISLEANSTPGYWKIEATLNDLATTQEFFVSETKNISFILEGQTLIVTNTGNVVYDGPLEIAIGGVKEIKEISDLEVGESKKYKLLAPEGNYDIGVSDGSSERNLGSAFLTGKAISVKDIGNTLSGNIPVLIGLIAILILAIVGLYIYRKISKRKGEEKASDQEKPVKILPTVQQKTKEQSVNVIDKGEKQESDILSLKIKNSEIFKTPNSHELKVIDSALWKATEAGAKVYTDGDYRIIVFTQILTKEKDNSLSAMKVAQTIERILKEHNKRAAQKIDFGIGINKGNLIVESKEGKFRFISTDNSIAMTKRISQEANSEILISESLHRKTVGKIKVEKVGDKNLWKLGRITDRSAHQNFIAKFRAKQAEDAEKRAKS